MSLREQPTDSDSASLGSNPSPPASFFDRPQSGLVLEAGTAKPIVIPYASCRPGYCEATANLAADFVETLTKTPRASVTIFAVAGGSMTFDVSVRGLAEGIAALRKASSEF